jgi:predicted phage-related endonuclease
MKTLIFSNDDFGREEWLKARLGRITGTRLKDLIVKRGTKPKIGFYEIIAERVAILPSDEAAMDRGIRLEDEAIKRFEKETGKKVNNDLVLWTLEDDDNIALSPDGFIGEKEAVEVKCLSSARHLEAWLTKEIPSEYEGQVTQYFIVNDKLQKLYFVFYDPRMPKDFFFFEVERKNIEERIKEYLELEKQVLADIKIIEDELTF